MNLHRLIFNGLNSKLFIKGFENNTFIILIQSPVQGVEIEVLIERDELAIFCEEYITGRANLRIEDEK